MDKLLTVKQAAEYLQMTPKTIKDWLLQGKLPGIKIGGWEWRIREADLIKFCGHGRADVSPGERTLAGIEPALPTDNKKCGTCFYYHPMPIGSDMTVRWDLGYCQAQDDRATSMYLHCKLWKEKEDN